MRLWKIGRVKGNCKLYFTGIRYEAIFELVIIGKYEPLILLYYYCFFPFSLVGHLILLIIMISCIISAST